MSAQFSAFVWGSLCGGLVVGLAAWVFTDSVSGVSSSPPPRLATEAPSDSRDARLREFVCVRERTSNATERQCEAERLAALACEARLAQCTGERTAVRKSWPEHGPESEEPEAYADILVSALEDCGLDPMLESVECTEYPCVAALRGDDRDPELFAEQLDQRVKACAPLRRAFGVGPEQLDALSVRPLQVSCGDQSEVMFILQTLDTRGDAWEAWESRGERDNLVDILRWMFRRGDDVAGIWDCDVNSG